MTLELRQSTLLFILIALLAVLIFGKPASKRADKPADRHMPIRERNARPTIDLSAMDQEVVDSFNRSQKEFHRARAK